jgi:acetolactate synthase I/II/III large subunit
VSATGVAAFTGGFPARVDRGRRRYSPQRLPYFPEHAAATLARFSTVVLIGELEPVSFFGYPGRPGRLVRPDQPLITLVGPTGPAQAALEALAEQLGAPRAARTRASSARPPLPSTGAITPQALAEAIAWVQPANAIVVDEGATSTGGWYYRRSAHSASHTYLTITGGAISFGMPCATGAAIAGRGRRVLSLQADGSAMYTLQALWTQARESCDVTTVICDNGAYRILGVELDRAGITAGPRSKDMVSLIPRLDWVSLAQGLGVPAVAVDEVASLVTALSRSIAEPGPMLIQARMAVDRSKL